MQEQVTKITLHNGLTVFLKEIHSAPLVSSWIWYRVGSRNEIPGLTGLSHWVEHMQFKGTPNFPSSVLDSAISREGGVWNAFTSMDWTAYFETLPREKIELAFSLEADRMVNSLFDPEDVASERTVIISEREGSENEPLFRLSEALQKVAFHDHPYKNEVIGEKDDLRTITREDLYNHYKNHYIPNNAVLTVAGDFESNHIMELIEKYFGNISPVAHPEQLINLDPPMKAGQQVEMEGPGETTYLQIAYRFPPATSPDFFPFMILDSLLSGPSNPSAFSGGGISNKTSRLYRELVEKEIAVGFYSGGQVTIDPFLYTTSITVHPKKDPTAALIAFSDQIHRLQDELIKEEEILRAIKQARAIFAYGSESITHQAAWMGFSEMFASYQWFASYLENLEKVTPGDIQKIAQSWMQPNQRIVGIYKPDGKTT